ncbi:MAG: DUF6057 family protein [Tannerellaceae bacterium]|nr:DUF6057 family protein [Tannerellaceae bacterium]
MRYKKLIYPVIIWGVLFLFLQYTLKYHFYHIEQNQLFLFSSSYLKERFLSIGGFSYILSDFLLQFFIYPYVGAFIIATLLTGIGIQMSLIIHRIIPGSPLVILSSIPPVSLVFIHFNFNYFAQGTIAYNLMLTAFYFYLLFKRPVWKVIYSLFTVALLFWLGGSVSILFASVVLLYGIVKNGLRSYEAIPGFLFAFFLSYAAVRFNIIGEYRFAFLPDMYYHHFIKPDTWAIYLSWICFPCIILCAGLLSKTQRFTGKKRIGTIGLLTLFVLGFFWYGTNQFRDQHWVKYKEMEYYARTGEWDKIIEMSSGKIENYLYACYLNMALSQKGELAGKMFSFEQMGPNGLLIPWNQTHIISMLLSDLYYTMCHTGASMRMAFEANVCSPGGNIGRMYQRLVETNLIYGEYPVAEKYIRLLEKTFYYKEWAHSHRCFLYNDTAVENDPELGLRRRSLGKKDLLFPTSGMYDEWVHIAMSNPENPLLFEYLGALILLNKDLDSFRQMIDAYYKTATSPVLPVSFQEAILVIYEREPDVWEEKGVSQAVVKQYQEYKKIILANNNKRNLSDIVKNQYGHTYWYYLMFKNS